MGYKNIAIFELFLLSVVLGRAFAVIDTQEQVAPSDNQQSFNSNNLGSLASSPSLTSSSSSSSKLLSETAVPGKSSRYIIRFARAPSSMIRFSRSPSSQIRFGRSQPFVRFGRSNELNDDYASRTNGHFTNTDKYIRFGKNGADELYDENIQVEPRSSGDSGFIRFGRSQNFSPLKADTLRAINWRNFLRLGRNSNANIRFAGKRDGSSTTNNHNSIPIEILLEKMAQQKQQTHNLNADMQNERPMINDDEQQMMDGIDTNSDQYQTIYSNGNDLEQN